MLRCPFFVFYLFLTTLLTDQCKAQAWVHEVSKNQLGALIEIDAGNFKNGEELLFKNKTDEWGRGIFLKYTEKNPRFALIKVTKGHIQAGLEVVPRYPAIDPSRLPASYRDESRLWMGIRVGPSLNRIEIKSTAPSFTSGYHAGIALFFNLGFADLGLDALYSKRKYTHRTGSISSTLKLTQFELPAIAWFRLAESEDWTTRMGAGGGIRMGYGKFLENIAGNATTNSYGQDISKYEFNIIPFALGFDANFKNCKLISDGRILLGSNRFLSSQKAYPWSIEMSFGVML